MLPTKLSFLQVSNCCNVDIVSYNPAIHLSHYDEVEIKPNQCGLVLKVTWKMFLRVRLQAARNEEPCS